MSCDACQDCGCDSITLPVQIGPTGATGATGAAGSNGSDGTTVLHNDTTQSTTTSATIALFTATKAYTLPANTLATVGSKLELTAIFSTTGITAASDSTAYIYLAGSSFTAKTVPFNIKYYKAGTDSYLNVKLVITKVSNTDIFVEVFTIKSDKSSGQAQGAFSYMEKTITVADLSANSLLIEARGKTAGTTTFNCEQLTINHLVK